MIKYIGSKRALIPWIGGGIRAIGESDAELSRRPHAEIRILEPFAGSCRVGYEMKRQGFFVIAGDYLSFSYILARTFIEADRRDYPPERIWPILQRLQALPGEEDWFVQRYACEARYFQPANAQKIAAIRKAIPTEAKGDSLLEAILLTSLLLAADKVDSTTGLQMAYLKEWAPRSYNPLTLEYPSLLPGKGLAYVGDALEKAHTFAADIAYLDPPYNQHSYAGNYHVWETLVRYDNPPVYGVAVKRADVRKLRSPFNSKKEAPRALHRLLQALQARYVVLSFSDEGYFTPEELLQLCNQRGPTLVLERTHKRYIGAQIGIYNPRGERVGQVSHTQNREFLYVIAPDGHAYQGLQAALQQKALSPSGGQAKLF
ncbi:MAG: restriction endonuclease subunit M [Bacteroidia bacterium]|nr:MAG: restriction endonuclease subunit M [Bacteroidia bacterium]